MVHDTLRESNIAEARENGDAQMSEGSSSLQRTIATTGSSASPFFALFTPE